MLAILGTIFDYLLVIVGILLLLIIIFSIVSKPFEMIKKKQRKEELKKAFDSIVEETMEELKNEILKDKKTKKED